MSSEDPSALPPPRFAAPGSPPPGSPPPGSPPPGSPPPGSPPLGQFQPGAWGPPYPLTAVLNTRPGIIPLRPLGVGDILDGAFKAFRRNQGPVLALSALVNAISAVPAILASLLLSSGIVPTSASFREWGGPMAVSFVVLALTTAFTTICLTVFVSYVVGEATLGRRATLSVVWAATRAKLGWAILLQLGLVLAILVPFGLALGPGIALLAHSNGDSGLGALLVLLAFVAIVPWSAWLATKTLFATPALVLESTSLQVAFRRSFALTRGLFWRTLGISLLAGIIVSVVGQILQFPLAVLFGVLAGSATADADSAVQLVFVGQSLALLVTSIVTIPFTATVSALLYIDSRIRREAFDQVLMRAANPGVR